MKELVWAVLALLPAAAQDDGDAAFDRTMVALRVGSGAERTGDTAGLRRAATDLAASGAEPLPGGEDLFLRWSRRGGRGLPTPFRDRVLGPGYRAISLAAKGVWRSQQSFLGGQRAQVGVVPVGAARFALHIAGDDRETVCHAAPSHGKCDWVPAYTARFSIEVRNTGPGAARYLIVVQ